MFQHISLSFSNYEPIILIIQIYDAIVSNLKKYFFVKIYLIDEFINHSINFFINHSINFIDKVKQDITIENN